MAHWETAGRLVGILNYLASSCLVAWAAAFYLADEPPQAKRVFFPLLLAFIARDLLNILLLLVDKAKDNPLVLPAVAQRPVVAALRRQMSSYWPIRTARHLHHRMRIPGGHLPACDLHGQNPPPEIAPWIPRAC